MYLTNVVCSGDLGCSVNLKEVCYRLVNTRYNPERFPGLIWQHRNIGGNCLVFSNGKMHCHGKAKSLREGIQRLRRYARVLQKTGLPVKLRHIQVMTASAFHILSAPLNMKKLVLEKRAVYEPELFPTTNFTKEGVTFSCFSTGKIIITGIKEVAHLDQLVYPTLVELELYTL